MPAITEADWQRVARPLIPHVNNDETHDIDLSDYSREHRDELARIALRLYAEEKGARSLEALQQNPPVDRDFRLFEIRALLRIRLSVFLEETTGVIRAVQQEREAEELDRAEAF